MRTRMMIGAALMLLPVLWAAEARAHCQVPCGIYDDSARVTQIKEHTQTIGKAVKHIAQLAGRRDAQSRNQLVRWVMTKEAHAEKIIRTLSDYFLAQKIKPVATGGGRAAYLDKLGRHHAVIVAAMKCKQTASAANVTALTKAIDRIVPYWR